MISPDASLIFERESALCDRLLDGENPSSALQPLLRAQAALQPIGQASPAQKVRLAGLLVDLGGHLGDEDLVKSGLAIFIDNYQELAKYLHPEGLEYNVGNAKKSLYDIQCLRNGNTFRPESITLITEAKNHYWKAIKLGAIDPQLLVNLANALDQCARVTEALLWFDRALSLNPTFGMAHLNRGMALLFLNTISGTYSISQLYAAKASFRLAETSGNLPEHLKEAARRQRSIINNHLFELGWNNENIESYEAQHRSEYEAHDKYWRFCLSNYLALSEHALYCQCAAARRDDLSITKTTAPIGGDFVPRLELLLNRMKSEFVLARSLFYQSIAGDEDAWDIHSFEGTFTELHEREEIGLKSEFLRTSFRLCFGILDRIAQGLNELYDLAEPSEALYFESFWRPRDQQKKGVEDRWRRINEKKNMGLVALYSLATDLNRVRGEWKHFKEFRNDLEHGLLVLLPEGQDALPHETVPSKIPYKSMSTEEFRERALQMLQFTASAIFSFAYCVREEGAQAIPKNAITIELDKKKIGKD